MIGAQHHQHSTVETIDVFFVNFYPHSQDSVPANNRRMSTFSGETEPLGAPCRDCASLET